MTLETATREDLSALLNGMGEFVERDSIPDQILRNRRMDVSDAELRQQAEELVGYLPASVTLDEVAEVGA